MRTSVVRTATAADAEHIANILAAAFYDDPPLVWILPDAHDRQRLSSAFFRPFVDLVLAAGHGYVTEDLAGASLWLDVDVTEDSADDPGLRDSIVAGLGTEYAKRFFVLDELLTAAHPGHASHAYLLFVGVRPQAQSQGAGRALLAPRLETLDHESRPAYLEASCERNARLYARLGFEPATEPVVLPQGPALQPMWREARTVSAPGH
jgi:GNAT superfamily N-acetyltransferase